jgi:predicted porin
MNKKLLAVAVAGALAAPGIALAQSSVTISGVFKLSVEGLKISNASAARAGTNTSYTRIADDSSRIIFSVTEDLGAGLSAIGQHDVRFKVDDSGNQTSFANVGGGIPAGNTFVGLRSKQWGQIIFGRRDVHYVNTESYIALKGDLRMDPTSLLSHIGTTAIANASRTQNIMHYTTPNWGGFTAIVGYSTNAVGADSDIGSTVRKGNAWVLNPNFEGRNFQIGYSYWRSRADGTTSGAAACPAAGGVATGGTVTATGAVTANCLLPGAGFGSSSAVNQRGDRIYGSYRWGGFYIGGAWDKSKLSNDVAGVETNNRTAWSIPAGYTWGPHEIHGHYTEAKNDKATVADDKAKMYALSYAYSLSKRTAVAVSYGQIKNGDLATYNFFTSTSLGDASGTVLPGEDPKLWGLTIRHAF